MRKAIVVGLTGQTGAGKSTVSSMLEKFGYGIVDADEVSRLVTEKGSPVLFGLQGAFGTDVVDDDGNLNRKLLAERAFADAESTKKLNDLLHPEILRLIRKKVNGKFYSGYEGVVIDAPQLFESGLNKECTVILSVTAPEEDRLVRIMERDGLTEEEARLRMGAQLDETFFRENSDIVIENTGSTEALHGQVTRAVQILEEVISGERVL